MRQIGIRRIAALFLLIALVFAWNMRFEKTSTNEDRITVAYARDRWSRVTYVQSWGTSIYGGDGKGTPVPVFSDTDLVAYAHEHMTEAERAAKIRYGIVTGEISETGLTGEERELLTSHGYAVTRWDFTDPAGSPDEVPRLAEAVTESTERLRGELISSALRSTDTYSWAWAGIVTLALVTFMIPASKAGRKAEQCGSHAQVSYCKGQALDAAREWDASHDLGRYYAHAYDFYPEPEKLRDLREYRSWVRWISELTKAGHSILQAFNELLHRADNVQPAWDHLSVDRELRTILADLALLAPVVQSFRSDVLECIFRRESTTVSGASRPPRPVASDH